MVVSKVRQVLNHSRRVRSAWFPESSMARGRYQSLLTCPRCLILHWSDVLWFLLFGEVDTSPDMVTDGCWTGCLKMRDRATMGYSMEKTDDDDDLLELGGPDFQTNSDSDHIAKSWSLQNNLFFCCAETSWRLSGNSCWNDSIISIHDSTISGHGLLKSMSVYEWNPKHVTFEDLFSSSQSLNISLGWFNDDPQWLVSGGWNQQQVIPSDNWTKLTLW